MSVKAVFVLMLAVVVLMLSSCSALADKDRATAARLEAEAELTRAEAARERAAAEAEAARVLAEAEADVERDRAEAKKLQVEAAAYERRSEAETSAVAERSAIRQAERDAAHERTLGLLPFVLLIAGVVVVGSLAVIAVAGGLRRRQEAPDPVLTFLLQRQERRLAELERAAYHQIALEQRHQLGAGVGPIVIYDEDMSSSS
jgi:hypothetical protein